MKKKIMAVMLSFVMLLSVVPLKALAGGEDGSVSISANKTTVEVGEEIEIIFKVNAETDPVGAVNFTVNLPNGLEYVSHNILVSTSDFMLSSYVKSSGSFGCGMTNSGKTGTFDVLKLVVKATDVGTFNVGATLGNMYEVDGSTKMNFGTVDDLAITAKISVTGVTIDKNLSLDLEESKTLTCTVNPSNATNKNLTFASDNTAVATVNETTGKITAVAEGTATITATTEDGNFKDTCVVTVECLHTNKTEHPAGTSSCTEKADGKYYTCDKCKKMIAEDGTTVITEVPKLPLAKHTVSQRALPEYLKTTGDCQNKAVYWKSCSVCNAKLESEGTFEDKFGSHKMETGLTQENNQHFYKCAVSGCTHKESVADCSGGTATCKKLAVCATCGNEYGKLAAHDFATEFSKDASGHWYACKTPNCTEKSGVDTHTPNISAPTEDDDQICAECSYVIKAALGHQCQLHLTPVTANEAKCEIEGNIAYYKCDCGELYKDAAATQKTDAESVKIKALGHDYTEKIEDEAHFKAEAQNCQEKTTYWYDCSRCDQNAKNDAKATDKFFGTIAGKHNIVETEWGYKVEEGHAHKCEFCDEHDTIVKHTPGEEATETTPQTCTECGYVIKKALGHSFGKEWESDKDNHWNVCACGEKGNVAAHVDENKDGKCDVCEHEVPLPVEPNKPEQTKGQWLKDNTGWWYQNPDGTYPYSCWKQIDGVWYYFNATGYMVTGWQSIGGIWYYFNGSGAMVTGWQSIGGTWYYFNGSGAMVTGWQSIGGTWYYLSGSGAMVTGWQSVGGTWYYLSGSGAMVTGWQLVGGTWYYLSGSGAMVTGWQLVGDTWYYLSGSGAMAANQWIGNYYLQADGSMATNKWIGNYYVGPDGLWIP